MRALPSLHEVSPRLFDAIAATGELASSRMVAAALAEAGVPAAWVDARQVMRHRRGVHLRRARHGRHLRARRSSAIAPVSGARRGGGPRRLHRLPPPTASRRRSAAAARTTRPRSSARVSTSSEIQIWTDVDGMLTADPRVVPQPRARAAVVVRRGLRAGLLRREGAASEHDSAGGVEEHPGPHPELAPARQSPGTLITADPQPTDGQLTAIACKRDVTVIDITSTRMFMAHGFLRRLFEVFERFKTAVDVVTTSEVSVSVTVDDARRVDAIVDNLRGFADVSLRTGDGDHLRGGRRYPRGSEGVRPGALGARVDSAADGVAGRVAPEHHVRAAGMPTCRRR